MPNQQAFFTAACLSGATAVGLGAFGAHALRSRLSAHQLASWSTAVSYQFVHTLALLYTISLPAPIPWGAAYAFTTGIGLFSGSIYGLCLTKEGAGIRKVLGPLTPIGGFSFIIGWSLLAFSKRGALRGL